MAKKRRTSRKKNPNRKLKKKIVVTKRILCKSEKKIRIEDVLQRECFDKSMQEQKLFKSNVRLVFEQDHARPHSTLKCPAFMEKNFPAFTPTIGTRWLV